MQNAFQNALNYLLFFSEKKICVPTLPKIFRPVLFFFIWPQDASNLTNRYRDMVPYEQTVGGMKRPTYIPPLVCLFGLMFYVPDNSYGHVEMVSSLIHTFPGQA